MSSNRRIERVPSVAEFQLLHDGIDGNPLVVDGIMGPMTRWVSDIQTLPRPAREAVGRMVRALGVQERTGRNDHPFIDFLLERCNLRRGLPWCAAGLSWALSPVGVTPEAGALKLLRAHEEVRDTPNVLDIMGFPTNDTGSGHVGGVLAADDVHSLCCEFNSDNRVQLVLRRHSEVSYSRPWEWLSGEHFRVNIPSKRIAEQKSPSWQGTL